MNEALWYLGLRTARNATAARLARLRNPRYALAVCAGILYFWLVFFRRHRPTPPHAAPVAVEIIAAVGLLVLAAWTWIFGSERALAFSPAEVAWLFPAPVSRRALVRYKLARGQLVVLFNTALWTALFAAERLGAVTWFKVVAVWVLLSTLQLHRLGASFVRSSLYEHGVAGLKHRLVSLLALGIAAAGIVSLVRGMLPLLQSAGTGPGFAAGLAAAAARPLAAAVLWPFRAVARPVAATSLAAWAATIGPALLILAGHYVWVLRSDAAFEEAAAEASFRVATRRRAVRDGTPLGRGAALSPALYRLRPQGPAAGAIVWKNFTMLARRRRVRVIAAGVATAAVLLAAWSFRANPTTAESVATLGAVWAGFLVVAAPLWIRNDLRADLLDLELIKTLPIGGRALVAAEVVGSAVVATAVQLALVLLAYAAVLGDRSFEVGLPLRTALLGAAMLFAPLLHAAGFTLQNTLALLFPAWARLGPRRGGIEVMGQTFLVMMGQAIAMAVFLIPPLLAAGMVTWMATPLIGNWSRPIAAIIVAGGMLLEIFLALDWLGGAFERTDITAVPAQTD